MIKTTADTTGDITNEEAVARTSVDRLGAILATEAPTETEGLRLQVLGLRMLLNGEIAPNADINEMETWATAAAEVVRQRRALYTGN